MRTEILPEGHVWFRIAETGWADPQGPDQVPTVDEMRQDLDAQTLPKNAGVPGGTASIFESVLSARDGACRRQLALDLGFDPTNAAVRGGRWNPPNSHPTLYLNEDRITARLNLRMFIHGWPYEPEDLRNDTGPVLVEATLPARQRVADVHSRQGLVAVKLPSTYPLDGKGLLVEHAVCQAIGVRAKTAGLRGVRARSARSPEGGRRELAWFPATRRSRARAQAIQPFETWYWAY